MFRSLTKSFFGSFNDKTIVKYDKFVTDLQFKNIPLFNDLEYVLLDQNGNEIHLNGAYLICDGGYLIWRVLMCPFKYFSIFGKAYYSAQLESVRKDVERSFGILKGRFRCLKLPILFLSQSDIDNVFFTCAILHNMIRFSDGQDRM